MRQLFISYCRASADEAAAHWLDDAARRSNWRVSTPSLRVSLDSAKLDEDISAAIDRAAALAFVSSSMSVSSKDRQTELAWAMALKTPIFVLETEAMDSASLPAAIFPLIGYRAGAAALFDCDMRAWPLRIAGAASAASVHLTALDIDPMEFPPDARVIRPLYSTDARTLERDLERLSRAQALNPSNGVTALCLALVRAQIRDFDGAQRDAAIALKSAPNDANSYYAAAIVKCATSPPAERSQAEVDRILHLLQCGRALPGAGGQLWLLSALVIRNFYLERLLTPPEEISQLLEAAAATPCDPGEAQRVWDVEGGRPAKLDAQWSAASEGVGFSCS